MKFKQAVESTSELSDKYREGLQALERKDKKYIECADPRIIVGSIDLDEALRKDYPQDPRWDYGIGAEIDTNDDRIVWLEVHPASTATVTAVIAKQVWLKKWLQESAHELKRMPARYVWVASGKVAIVQHANQVKRLASLGIVFAGTKYKIKDE
jgi:hypothetical protein